MLGQVKLTGNDDFPSPATNNGRLSDPFLLLKQHLSVG